MVRSRQSNGVVKKGKEEMKLVGMSLAKNANKYQYPLRECILQHTDLFDEWWFIVPKKEQDTDGTWDVIQSTCREAGLKFFLYDVDWPTGQGFHKQSIDKILQSECVRHLDKYYGSDVWILKQDIDEFLHEDDFSMIRETVDLFSDSNMTLIGFGYRQFVGSVYFSVFDPTKETYHLYRNRAGAYYPGNDAMNLETNGDRMLLDTVLVNHVGYVKSEELLSVKLKEHIILNSNVYPDVRDLENVEFKFPLHVPGKRLWPLGIAVLRGQPNETEYFPVDLETVPKMLRKNAENLKFFLPY